MEQNSHTQLGFDVFGHGQLTPVHFFFFLIVNTLNEWNSSFLGESERECVCESERVREGERVGERWPEEQNLVRNVFNFCFLLKRVTSDDDSHSLTHTLSTLTHTRTALSLSHFHALSLSSSRTTQHLLIQAPATPSMNSIILSENCDFYFLILKERKTVICTVKNLCIELNNFLVMCLLLYNIYIGCNIYQPQAALSVLLSKQ